jgi:hypothetical protein
MLQTNHAPYPVERTLVTTGILAAVMISKAEKYRRVKTPHLEIWYQRLRDGPAAGASEAVRTQC